MTQPPDGTYFDLDRVLAHAPDRVFEAWTDPALHARWCWGSLGRDVECRIDPRPGGAWSAYTAADPAKLGRERVGMLGVYVELVPAERIVYTLHWDAPVGYNEGDAAVPDEVVCVTLEPAEAGTRVVVRHMGIPADPEGISVREHGRGWGDVLDALAHALAGS